MNWSKLPLKYQRILDDIYVTLQYVRSKGTADDIKTAREWARNKTAWVLVHYADEIRKNQSFYMLNGQAVSTAVPSDKMIVRGCFSPVCTMSVDSTADEVTHEN